MSQINIYLAELFMHRGGGRVASAMFTFPPSRGDIMDAFSIAGMHGGVMEMADWRHPPEPLANDLVPGDSATYAVSNNTYLRISVATGYAQ